MNRYESYAAVQVVMPIQALVSQIEDAWREILPDLGLYPLDAVRNILARILVHVPHSLPFHKQWLPGGLSSAGHGEATVLNAEEL